VAHEPSLEASAGLGPLVAFSVVVLVRREQKDQRPPRDPSIGEDGRVSLRKRQLLAALGLSLLVVAGIGSLADMTWLAIGAGLAGSLLMLWLGLRYEH
jgi:hypothetical protein